MIRVIVGANFSGRFDYKIMTENTRLAAPLTGLSATPLFDACRTLKQLGAAEDSAMIGLFNTPEEPDNRFRLRTTVGYGAKMTVREDDTKSAQFVPYKPFTADPSAFGRGTPQEAEKTSEGGVEATGAKSAKPEAIPPPPHTPPTYLADKGRGLPKPPKQVPKPRKRKRAGSSGRRGQR